LNVFFFKQIIEKVIIGLKNRALKKLKTKERKEKQSWLLFQCRCTYKSFSKRA